MSWSIELRGHVGSLHYDLSYEVASRELTEQRSSLTLLIGPNGAGKTTLLRTIAGARLPLSGRIVLNGRTLLDTPKGVDLPPHERRIGYVPQGYALFPHLSVEANVAFGCGRGRDALLQAHSALERFDALHLRRRYPETLSHGEQQRVSLARAVAAGPEALLLDEPLAALDPSIRRRTRALLANLLCSPISLRSSSPTIFATSSPSRVRCWSSREGALFNPAPPLS